MMPMNEEKVDMNRSENSSMSSMISATGIYFYPWVSLLTLIFTSFFGSVGNLIVVTVYGLKRNKNASECFILQVRIPELRLRPFILGGKDQRKSCTAHQGEPLLCPCLCYMLFFGSFSWLENVSSPSSNEHGSRWASNIRPFVSEAET